MSIHHACLAAQTGVPNSLSRLACLSLAATAPRTLASLHADDAEPPPDVQIGDCHVLVCYMDGIHSLNQRHFPTGALVNTIDNVGAVRCVGYRESDGAVAGCVKRWGGDVWLLWGRFGDEVLWKEVGVEAGYVSIGEGGLFGMGIGGDIALFEEREAGIAERGRKVGRGWERVCGLGWMGRNVVYGLGNGEVRLWDTRAQEGAKLFSTNWEGMCVSRIVVGGGEVYVSVDYTDERALSAWDVRMCERPVRVFEVPRVGGRCSFDVDARGGVLAGGSGDEVWLWDCWRGGGIVGGWRFQGESVRRVGMVGWGGRRGGVYVETDCDRYYVALGGRMD